MLHAASRMPFPVDIKFVTETERKLGVKFPPAYLNAMVKSNGGGVEAAPDYWHLYPIFDTSDKKRLKRTCNDVIRETKSANDWPDFPPNAVAIGANGGGDQLIMIPQNRPSGIARSCRLLVGSRNWRHSQDRG